MRSLQKVSAMALSCEVGLLVREQVIERDPVHEAELQLVRADVPRDQVERRVRVDEKVPEFVRRTLRAVPLETDALSRAALDALSLLFNGELSELLLGDVTGRVEVPVRLHRRCRLLPLSPEGRGPSILVEVD